MEKIQCGRTPYLRLGEASFLALDLPRENGESELKTKAQMLGKDERRGAGKGRGGRGGQVK